MTVQKDPEQTETKYLHKFADFTHRRVLEIGCGEGRLTWRYARRSGHVTGIDLDPDSLRVATIERPSDLEERVTFCRADSIHLPFSKEQFDLVILSWSF
jgi:ubiquinone/menaquinone biosynthesis C-methylase UbiE